MSEFTLSANNLNLYDVESTYRHCNVRVFFDICNPNECVVDWECSSTGKTYKYPEYLMLPITWCLVDEVNDVYVQVLKNTVSGYESIGWSYSCPSEFIVN